MLFIKLILEGKLEQNIFFDCSIGKSIFGLFHIFKKEKV